MVLGLPTFDLAERHDPAGVWGGEVPIPDIKMHQDVQKREERGVIIGVDLCSSWCS